jgi:transposase
MIISLLPRFWNIKSDHFVFILPKTDAMGKIHLARSSPANRPGRGFALKRRPYQRYRDAPWAWHEIFGEVEDAQRNGGPSMRAIARKYNVNINVLSKRLKRWQQGGRGIFGPTGDARGRRPTFTAIEAKAIAESIDETFLAKNKPLVDKDVSEIAQTLWTQGLGRHGGRSLFKAGKSWTTRFKRRQGFTSRRPSHSRVAAKPASEEEIKKFKSDATAALHRFGSKRVFNFDQTSWKVLNKPTTTWVKKGPLPKCVFSSF